jgi:hypothetical protein
MPTFSGFAKKVFRAGLYEAQDVLVSCDDVDLIHLQPASGLALKEKWLTRFAYHTWSSKLASCNPGLQPVRLKKDYDLFLLVCPLWPDVLYANAIDGWRDHCRTSICWIDELWAHGVSELHGLLSILERFDYVVVGINGSGQALSNVLGRPCREMMGAVDAIRFTPYPKPPARVIDVYNIGRRREGIHQQLRDLASTSIFYVHDTFRNPGDSETPDYSQHRELYASLAKRSRFFVVAPGKVDRPSETNGQVSLGFRFFEGSAAGAVLLGQAPDCEGFRHHFDWPDAVIEIRPDGSDAWEVISRLSADPEQFEAISRRNAEQALRRHDWLYRWKDILALAGLTPTAAMVDRENRLRELAALTYERCP